MARSIRSRHGVSGAGSRITEIAGYIVGSGRLRQRCAIHATPRLTPAPAFVILGRRRHGYRGRLDGSVTGSRPSNSNRSPPGSEQVAHDSQYPEPAAVVPSDTDFVPSLARIPAGNATEVRSFRKVIAYETSGRPWRGRMMLLSDDQYSSNCASTQLKSCFTIRTERGGSEHPSRPILRPEDSPTPATSCVRAPDPNCRNQGSSTRFAPAARSMVPLGWARGL